MVWDDGLEGTARDIAASNEKKLRVMAGPGTGKSFALQRRIARLLEEGQNPKRILAVTFTRTAAASLRKDLEGTGVDGCEHIEVSTLHSYCFKMLKREEVFEYLGRTPRSLMTFDKSKAMQFEGRMLTCDLAAADDRFRKTRDSTKRIRAFEAAWARLQHEEPGWASDPTDQAFQAQLSAWLDFHNAMLVGELIPEALRFLQHNPASEPMMSFDHVIVDEYQDLNRAEQEIVDLLAQNGSISIVGDVDQSIYSFRYANPDGITDFRSRHPSTHDETLEHCRRCPTRVVAIADHLIMHNHPQAKPPRLRPLSENLSGDIHVVQWGHPIAETIGLASYVQHLINDQGFAASDILILTPRRQLAYQLRDRLRGSGILAHSFYREEALEAMSAQEAFCLLTLLADPDDRVALRWWLGRQSSKGLSGSYAKLRAYCEREGISPWDALVAVTEDQIKIPGTKPLLAPFSCLRDRLASLQTLPLSDVIADLLPEGDGGCEAFRMIADFEVEEGDCETISDLLSALRSHVTQPEAPEGEFLRIMSLQKAKGLTSRIVIVSACIQGLIPVIEDDLTPEEREESIREQRRLFYVAITRCKDTLVISSVAGMQRSLAYNIGATLAGGRGEMGKTITSRYVDELGPDAPRMMHGEQWRAGGFATS